MRIGIVADIHDAVVPLGRALALLQRSRVDRILTLGDAVETFMPDEPGVEVARLLRDAGAIGVWGNHDAALSYETPREIRETADPAVLAFAERLQPHLVIEDCRFCHLEPFRDPRRTIDMWTFEGVPETTEQAARCFEAVEERLLVMGHFHQWLALGDRTGRMEWSGERPLRLPAPHRYMVIVAPVLDGWCAVLDTDRAELTPLRCGA